MLPRAPAPEADPKAENARQIALGKQALANQEYGRAAERFRQATIVAPAEALAHFFLAEAYFAIVKYREAVATIQAGLNLQPDWPSAKFRPKDWYGANVAEFPEHLQRLSEALKRHTEDPVLLFLYGYQLWFDGRQVEARRLFEQAARLVPDPSFIELFLKARRDMAVVKKP